MADSSDTSAPKTFGKPFLPGQSGNPGGKNAERERLRKAFLDGTEEMMGVIRDLALNATSEKVRMSAAAYWCDQGVGKALVAISGEDGAPLQVTFGAELVDALKRMGEAK